MRNIILCAPFVLMGVVLVGCGANSGGAADSVISEKQVVLKVPGMT